MVREAITQLEVEVDPAGLFRNRSQLGQPATLPGQVELVRLGDQLRHPWQMEIVEGLDQRAHLQRAMEFVEAGRRGGERACVPLRPVLLGPLQVLLRQRHRFEPQVIGEAAPVSGRVLGQVDDIDLGQQPAD